MCVFFFCYIMYNVLGDIIPLCISQQSKAILISDKHYYIDLAYLIFIRHYCLFRLSTSAIIRYGKGSQKSKPISYLMMVDVDSPHM